MRVFKSILAKGLGPLWLLIVVAMLTLFSNGVVADTSNQEAVKPDLELDVEAVPSANPFTEEQEKAAEAGKETFAFQTEVSRVMNIIIHSLYKNKEIFLRELISNGSDALDKIRFLSLTDSEQLKANNKLQLSIKADKEANTLTITDTGIGMTAKDLKKNLGTIAKSGTADFLKAFEAKDAQNSNLIGQFGVGFYSAFLVADKVVVVSKNAKDDQHIWESSAISNYSIVKDPRGNTLGRGTQITLHLKDDAKEFLDPKHLEELIVKYSEFIEFPIYLWTKYQVTENVSDDDNESDDDAEVVDEDKTKEDKPKTVTKDVVGFKLMNLEPPIWTKDPKSVTDEEHSRLFGKLNENLGKHASHIHFKAEGDSSFKSILYLPELGYESLRVSKTLEVPVKLYVKRVFITDTTVKLLPDWLAFLRGLVDCDDIPLNVSRETVQNSRIVRVIKKKLLSKAFEMFNTLSNDPVKYEKFLGDFGPFLKKGIREDEGNQEKIAKLLRFPTSSVNSTSFEQYIERMAKDQKKIYFITGGSMEALKRSPYVEKLVKSNYEVIYMDQPVDEFTMQHLRKFKGLDFVHALAAQNEIKDDKKDLEKLEKTFKPLVDWFTKVLGDQVETVKLSTRLIYSPTAITPSTLGGLSGNQERLMKAQAFASQHEVQVNKWLNARKGLELNPTHPIILKLLELVKTEPNAITTRDTAHLLFQTSMLRSDYDLPSPQAYADRVEKLVRAQLQLDTKLSYPDVLDVVDDSFNFVAEQDEDTTENGKVEIEVDEHDEL